MHQHTYLAVILTGWRAVQGQGQWHAPAHVECAIVLRGRLGRMGRGGR